jgi:NADH-quinone oxidoreductase subunit J
MQIGIGVGAWVYSEPAAALAEAATEARAGGVIEVENSRALGLLLYDRYILLFQLSGLILLVAMIGAILLTLRHRRDIKRQNVLQQMWRDPAKAMELRDVKPGQGL